METPTVFPDPQIDAVEGLEELLESVMEDEVVTIGEKRFRGDLVVNLGVAFSDSGECLDIVSGYEREDCTGEGCAWPVAVPGLGVVRYGRSQAKRLFNCLQPQSV